MVKQPIVKECEDALCGRIFTGPSPGVAVCSAYENPSYQWRRGRCPLAPIVIAKKDKVFEDPLKAAKKLAKAKAKK